MSSSIPPNNKEFVAISINDISVSYPPTGEWFCNRCHVSYFPSKGEKVKRPSKFETPGPLTDKHGNITGEKWPLVAMVDDTLVTVTSANKSRLPPSIKALKERTGVNVTDFHSTVDDESL